VLTNPWRPCLTGAEQISEIGTPAKSEDKSLTRDKGSVPHQRFEAGQGYPGSGALPANRNDFRWTIGHAMHGIWRKPEKQATNETYPGMPQR